LYSALRSEDTEALACSTGRLSKSEQMGFQVALNVETLSHSLMSTGKELHQMDGAVNHGSMDGNITLGRSHREWADDIVYWYSEN